MSKHKAQRIDEHYGGGTDFRIRGLSKAEAQAAKELAKEIARSGSVASQVKEFKKRLGK